MTGEARPDLALRRELPRGLELRLIVASLPGRVLDALLDAAMRRDFDVVEKELRRRRVRAA